MVPPYPHKITKKEGKSRKASFPGFHLKINLDPYGGLCLIRLLRHLPNLRAGIKRSPVKPPIHGIHSGTSYGLYRIIVADITVRGQVGCSSTSKWRVSL